MKSSSIIRSLYRFQQRVGLTAQEFRALCVLGLLAAVGLGFDAWRIHAGRATFDDAFYATEDSIFAAATARFHDPWFDEDDALTLLPAVPDTLDLNTADRDALMTLPRIGPAMADRILEYRDRFGPFLSVDDLLIIRGIGPATLEGLRPMVKVAPLSPDTASVVHP